MYSNPATCIYIYTPNSTAARRNWRRRPQSSHRLDSQCSGEEEEEGGEEEEEEKEDLRRVPLLCVVPTQISVGATC